MFSVYHLNFRICTCVLCTLFVASYCYDEKRAVSNGELLLKLDCDFYDGVINITSITVANMDAPCTNDGCIMTEDETLEIEKQCNGKNSCVISSISNNSCLMEFGSFNVTYSCEFVSNIGPKYECNFEQETLCGWNTSGYGNYTWRIGSGGKDTTKDKPDHDHTTKSDRGHYLYLQFTGIPHETKTIHFFRNVVDAHNGLCVSFWHYISRCDAGNLQIHQVFNPYQNKSNLLWHSSTTTENSWEKGNIFISGSNINYWIYFVAMRTKETSCIIALDDIRLVRNKCREPLTTNENCKNLKNDNKLEINKCASKYTPSDLHLEHGMLNPDCIFEYQKIRSTSQTAFQQCTNTNNGECNIDIASTIMNKRKCFLANKLVVDYVCIVSDETQSLTTIYQSSSSVKISTPMQEQQSTGSHETQSITTIHVSMSLSDEHNTMYIVIGTSLAAIGCIIIFVVSLVLIKRRKMGDKPKKENNKLCNDAQSIQDPSKTNKSQIQLDLVYSSPCDSFVKSKNTDNIPRYAVPSSGYYTTNQITRKENAIYQLPNPVSETDTYAESVDGVYDTSGSRKHVEDSDTIYNHSVDSIYDHTRSEKDMTDNDAMYDRTFTYVTDSLYDVSRR